MSDDYPNPLDSSYFVDCTCEHPPEDHDWGQCTIKGCTCEGHWEE